ncbi:MAG TPA: nickel ABC transporter permease [Acidimicrobiales bacterium]|nr:nickel ABC transporter permease [Acidimicrobiales bacterium]
MFAFVVRRLLLVIPTVIGISLLTFVLSNLTPGDPAFAVASRRHGRPANHAEVVAVRHELGLDRPGVERYLNWAGGALRGDLGRSYSTQAPVRQELFRRVPHTLQLAVPAMLLAVLIAVPAGVLAAMRRNRPVDQVMRVLSLAGACMPSFWLALLLIILFSVRLHLLPVAGRGGLDHIVLPVVTLAMAPAAILARFTRSAMLEALGSRYVLTARAKGLHERRVVAKHALRNALVPVVTSFGVNFGILLAGATVIETIFVWPGVGSLLVGAIQQRDYPTVEAFVLYSGVLFAVLNLVVDVSYALIDPRIVAGSSA